MSDSKHRHHHHHSEEHRREVSNRLARAIGHLQKVKQMVDDDEDCSDVLIQLAAVKSAINNTGKVILKDHMEHCIVHAVEDGDTEMIDELNAAIDKFMK
ncbi:MAG: metal-sensing transcriptional repressor [Eubacterium coprostanoligenes]|uniref:DNA-binding transcriptional regulator, FrmR family n=1 Tax=Eubacterium coprostanoligenes TaxID=290054 RepID=A0A1T4M8U4_9FIRM|nr:metal-sensing transcriptional repressor [Eubacterium coprostanoligenes]MCI7264686.1 metal-sensing transcriptional repressor [Eubacterium coprostanoligenes]SJZ63208.1 DNA-binding transcriptional regulator, FrmR family [Eubacterium coprostanoligenes]